MLFRSDERSNIAKAGERRDDVPVPRLFLVRRSMYQFSWIRICGPISGLRSAPAGEPDRVAVLMGFAVRGESHTRAAWWRGFP